MRQFCLFTLLLASLITPATAVSAQGTATGTITGRVVDQQTQQGISDVNVTISGTTLGTRTAADGTFRISGVRPGPVVVRAARIGFAPSTQTVRVTADAASTARFALNPTAVTLDVVVTSAVTGRAERRREVGANVSNINVAEIQQGPITKFTDILAGRATGVTMQSPSGTSGTSQRIRIRGANSLSLSNEPLVFLDGAQVTNSNAIGQGVGGQAVSRLNDINPDDIENIEILKGPAASALYGTAAANGVLLITTKRGRAGKPVFNAYVERGSLEDRTDYPSNYLSYLAVTPNAPLRTSTGAFNFAARVPCTNSNAAAGLCTRDSLAVFNPLRDPRTTPYSTGDNQSFGVSASGGNESVRYFVSADQQREQGVISYNTFRKSGIRANLDTRFSDKVDLRFSSSYTDSRIALNSNDNSIFSPLINGINGSAFFYDTLPDGKRSFRNYGFGFTPEDLAEFVANQEVDRFTLGAITGYRPAGWLRANLNLGLDYINRHDFRTLQPGRLPIAQSFTIGNRGSTRANQYLYTGSGSLEARFTPFWDIASTSTVGAGYNRNLLESTVGFGAGIVEGTRNLGATSSLFSVDEGFNEVISVGGFVQQQFAWKDRVFLAASVRGDDNSAFGNDFGFIVYPGASLSWVVSEEPWFMNRLRFVSNLRLRAAYGRSGLRPDFRDAVTFFSPVAVSVAGQEVSAVTLASTGNLDLRPEKSDEVEFGFDAGLLDGRLSLEFTNFNKTSRDALIRRLLPPSLGLTGSQFVNIGEIRNSGTELSLDARVFDTERAGLSVRISSTDVSNRIEDLGKTATGDTISDIILNRGAQRHQRTRSAGAFFQRPIRFNDADGNGLLSRSEVTLGDSLVFMGHSIPRYTRSISVDLRILRSIRISTLFEGRGGFKQFNFTEAFRCVFRGDAGCVGNFDPGASLEDQAAFIANRFGGAAPSKPGASSAGYIEDASFVKWREASISFALPASLTRNIAMLRGASLTFSGRNLKTWTDYPGLDPEIVEAAATSFNQSEFNTQPPVRYFLTRLNFTF